MNKPSIPSPREHPNSYAALSSGALAAFLVVEAKRRFGIDVTYEEAGMAVATVSTLVLFFGKKAGVK